LNAAVFEPGVLEVDGTELSVDASAPFPGTIEETEDGLTLRWPTSR